jgi:hypothetical protein
MKTCVIEKKHIGGICLIWGCIPTKALLRSAEIYNYMKHASDYGLSASGIEFAYPRIDKIDGNEPTIEQLLFRGESGFLNTSSHPRSVLTPVNGGSYGRLQATNRYLNWFNMDGTDDYISVPPIQYTPSQSWTVEVVFNPWDVNDTSWSGIFGGNLNGGGYWMFHSSQLTYYEGSDSNGSAILYTGWNKSTTFPPNNFHHLTIVYESISNVQGNFKIYLNGLEKTQTFNWTFTFGESLYVHSLGRGATNRPGTNNITSFKLWDTDLEEKDVVSNYKAHKNKINMGGYPI